MREHLIGSADACDILGIDRSTLIRWVQLGKITPVQRLPGQTGAFLFARGDVDKRADEYAAERVAS